MANIENWYSIDDEPQADFEPIPAGNYLAKIVESETKSTSKGDGQYLEIKLQICEGDHKNRVLIDRLNLKNPNTVAVEIARKTFASIREATGVNDPRDSEELHNIPMTVKVACEKSTYKGEERINNVIKKYSRRGAAPVAEQRAANEGSVEQHVQDATLNM